VTSHSYLKLLPSPIADAISKSRSQRRHRFAVACARLSVDHCAYAVLALDDFAKQMLATLCERTLAAIDTPGAEAFDRELMRDEDQLYERICALRCNDAEAPYAEFVRLTAQRHTIRALRATLLPDGLSAAARGAFEAISATRNEAAVMALARETLLLDA
jgi:hypothetical protein